MARGYLSLLLHAHLPFVRHPEHDEFLEERWLFEAVAGCYLPLISVFERLAADGIPFRITMSVSPTLAAMLDDPLLRKRCHAHIGKQRAIAEKSSPFLAGHFAAALKQFEDLGGDIVAPLRRLHQDGRVDLITTAATHGFLPLLKTHPPSVRAQIRIALDEHVRRFGDGPEGFWLPECGFYPGLDRRLAAEGLRYSVVDSHAFLAADPMPVSGTFAPVVSNGIAVFARDADSAREVWGPGGFPGAAVYRDFHATDAHGLKTFAVTGPSPEKRPYDPASAREAAMRHAMQFVDARVAQAEFQSSRLSQPPVILAAYDAELFGHWWFEGPQFIEHVIRTVAARSDEIELVTPSDYLDRHPAEFEAQPGASSWGQHGFNDYWLNAANHWIHPQLRQAAMRLTKACTVNETGADRALRQAARSLLIAQASDWPFMMTRGASASYAEKRLRDQIARVHFLCDAVEKGAVDERRLRALEAMDNLFPNLDCRHFMEA